MFRLPSIVTISAMTLSACSPTTDGEQISNATAVDSVTEQSIHQGYSDTAPQYEVDGRVKSNVDTEATLWNPRGKTDEQIAARATFLASVYDLERTEAQLRRAAEAREKYKDSIVINSVIPMAPGTLGTTDEHYAKGLRRNRDAGFTLASTSIYGFPGDGDSSLSERTDKPQQLLATLTWCLRKTLTQSVRPEKTARWP